jgi:molecular chaperone GrpE (heat shock protein)
VTSTPEKPASDGVTPDGSTPEDAAARAGAHARDGETLLGVSTQAARGTELDWSDHVEAILDGVDGLRERISRGAQQAADGDTVPLDALRDTQAPQRGEQPRASDDADGAAADHDEQTVAETLRQRLVEAEAQRDEYLGDLQRLQASFENYRKRIEAETELARTRQRNQVLSEILPLLDDLAHLEDSSDAGAAAVAASADSIAARLGLVRISGTGVAFDPYLHEAVAVRDRSEADGNLSATGSPAENSGATGDGEPDENSGATGDGDGPTVSLVLRPGWRHHQVTLRPALVEVLR